MNYPILYADMIKMQSFQFNWLLDVQTDNFVIRKGSEMLYLKKDTYV